MENEAAKSDYTRDQPVEYLFRRSGKAFWIEATVICPHPLEIKFTKPGSKSSESGITYYRKLRTPADCERIRPRTTGEAPLQPIDPEQRLRDAVWNGEIDGRTTREIAADFDLERRRTHHVLVRVLRGKSIDKRFGKPQGSHYHDKRALISGGRIFTCEPVPGPPINEYRWFIQIDGDAHVESGILI